MLSEINIPSSITSIGNHSFERCINLNEITIPSSVTSIGEYAFNNCMQLTNITLPSSITSIGEYAFYNCHFLANITLPSSITSIRKFTFSNCGLKKIIIPESVISIRDYSFDECYCLEEVIIPSSVASIGKCVFRNCNSLVNLKIPSNIKYIDISAFETCSSLDIKSFPILNLYNERYMEEIPYFKIAVFGDHGVGKTSIVGSDIHSVLTQLNTLRVLINGNCAKIFICDTPGQDMQRITRTHYRSINGIIFIFDFSKPITFDHIKQHLERGFEFNGLNILLGNKCDLEHFVKDEDINELVKKYNLKYFEISTKNDINVIDVYEYIAEFVNKFPIEKINEEDYNNENRDTNKKKCAIY